MRTLIEIIVGIGLFYAGFVVSARLLGQSFVQKANSPEELKTVLRILKRKS